MLSTFPTLLAYGLIGSFLVRITLGIVLLRFSYEQIKGRKSPFKASLGLLQGVLGILLVVGFLTQLAALIAAIVFVVKLVFKIKTKSLFTDGVNYYFILFMLAVSILFLGAGAFAFDYPL